MRTPHPEQAAEPGRFFRLSDPWGLCVRTQGFAVVTKLAGGPILILQGPMTRGMDRRFGRRQAIRLAAKPVRHSERRRTVMKCREVEKLVHRMLDGDLGTEEKQAVCAHMQECKHCAQYYDDMAAICDAAWIADPEPPEGFERSWKHAVLHAHPEKRKPRASRIIPAVACGVVGVFVISTALVNPQAFGLGGSTLRSDQATVTPPAQTESAEPAPIVFNEVVPAPTKEPKPAVLNGGYWEETVWSSATPTQVVSGDIEVPEESEPAETQNAKVMPEEPEPQEEPETLDLVAPGIATIEAMRSYAEDTDGISVTEGDGVFLEGAPEKIALFLNAFGYDGPDGTTKVHITCEDAG